MASSDRCSGYGLSTIAIFALATAAAVAIVACQTNANGIVAHGHRLASGGHADRTTVNPLETFLERWTTRRRPRG